MNCKNAEMLIHARLDDELSVDDAIHLGEHLAVCGNCQTAISELDRVSALALDLPEHPAMGGIVPGVMSRIQQECGVTCGERSIGKREIVIKKFWRPVAAVFAAAALFSVCGSLYWNWMVRGTEQETKDVVAIKANHPKDPKKIGMKTPEAIVHDGYASLGSKGEFGDSVRSHSGLSVQEVTSLEAAVDSLFLPVAETHASQGINEAEPLFDREDLQDALLIQRFLIERKKWLALPREEQERRKKVESLRRELVQAGRAGKAALTLLSQKGVSRESVTIELASLMFKPGVRMEIFAAIESLEPSLTLAPIYIAALSSQATKYRAHRLLTKVSGRRTSPSYVSWSRWWKQRIKAKAQPPRY